MLRSRLLTLVERNVVLRERHASYDQSRFAARHTQSKSVENYFLASWNTNCRPAFRPRYAPGSGWIEPLRVREPRAAAFLRCNSGEPGESPYPRHSAGN